MQQVVAELLVDFGRLDALLGGHAGAGDEEQRAERREQSRHRLQGIVRLRPLPRPFLHVGRRPERRRSLEQLGAVLVVQVRPARPVENESHALREVERFFQRLLHVLLRHRLAGVDDVLAALGQGQRHDHVEARPFPDRHDRRLRRLRRPPDGLDHGLVRRHIEGGDELRLGRDVRLARVLLEHQRP